MQKQNSMFRHKNYPGFVVIRMTSVLEQVLSQIYPLLRHTFTSIFNIVVNFVKPLRLNYEQKYALG